jgi:hypothetical protein
MRRDNHAFSLVIELMPGRAYRFRYLLDGERWLDDWAADEHVPDEVGGADSHVDLAALAPATVPTTGTTVDIRPSTRCSS